MPKALIFGINGQDGFYLRQLLLADKVVVNSVSRSDPGLYHEKGDWLQGDVANASFVEQLIRAEKPDYIFHLAANSSIHHDLLLEHQATIVKGSLNILEAVFNYSPHSKVFITGSGLQFVNTGNPITEKDSFFAGNAYTLARIQAVYAARYYRTKGIKVYVGYLFHHDSPLRTTQHLNKKIVDAVQKIRAGENISLMIGDVSVEKEFGFAGDIVEGIYKLVQQDNIFEACIGTGKAYSIEKWLEICFSSINKRWQDFVQLNNEYVPDFKRLVSDPSVIKKLHWKVRVDIHEVAQRMLKINEQASI